MAFKEGRTEGWKDLSHNCLVIEAQYPATQSRSEKHKRTVSVFLNKSVSNFAGKKKKERRKTSHSAAQSRKRIVKP